MSSPVFFASWILPSLLALVTAWVFAKQQQQVPGNLNNGVSGGGGGGGDGLEELLVEKDSSPPPLEQQQQQQQQYPTPHSPQYATFVIGDLHGDVECAQHWVHRTGLVMEVIDDDLVVNEKDQQQLPEDSRHHRTTTKYNKKQKMKQWKWMDPTSHLIFMGDYVDKGPFARQTVEFVQQLTEMFPHHVTALLGNHELELLLDRDVRRWEVWGGAGFHALSYASVHPQEYMNYIPKIQDSSSTIIASGGTSPTSSTTTTDNSGSNNNKNNNNRDNSLHRRPDETDEWVIDALYNASMEVYSLGLHQEIFMTSPDRVGTQRSIVQFIGSHLQTNTNDNKNNQDDSNTRILLQQQQQQLVSERLKEYQQCYLNAYKSGTSLGDWLEQRPILVQRNETIFVHGGISSQAAELLKLRGGIDGVNQLFATHAHEDRLYDFMDGTLEGEIIYSDMVTYRGNHHPSEENCPLYLSQHLPEGVTRLGVGHTPGSTVRFLCDGTLLAVDASLSRWFRNSGNEYCPGRNTGSSSGGGSSSPLPHQRQSSNGRYTCQEMNSTCQGQIVKLTEGGKVEILQ